jgi:DNA-binding transcriptional LysR family regulator
MYARIYGRLPTETIRIILGITRVDPTNLSLRQLRAFVVVARCRSFIGASKELCITPSALSESIRQLELTLGVRLFDRTTRSVDVTKAGEEFLVDTSQVLRMIDASRARMGELGSAERGVVRAAGVPSIHANLTAPAVASLMRTHPGIRFALVEDEISGILTSILEGQVDFGMGVVPGGTHESLIVTPLISDVYGVIAREDHEAFRLKTLRLETLTSWNYIGVALGAEMEEKLSGINVSSRAEVNGFGSMIALLEEGAGVSVLPALAGYRMLRPNLKFRPFCDPTYERNVSLLMRPGRALSPAAQLLWNELLLLAKDFRIPKEFVADRSRP